MIILSDIFSSITWWYCWCNEDISVYWRDWWIIISSITCSHNSQTLHLSCLITSSIFSSLTDIDMSLIFLVDRLWLLERLLLHEWKLCMMTFLIMQHFNIIQTALNWDLLTLLTSIWTQNRIKRFVVDIMYRWISLSAHIFKILKSFFVMQIILSKYHKIYHCLSEVNHCRCFHDQKRCNDW